MIDPACRTVMSRPATVITPVRNDDDVLGCIVKDAVPLPTRPCGGLAMMKAARDCELQAHPEPVLTDTV